MSNPPEDLEQARRLLEVPPRTSHSDLMDDEPVSVFLDHDSRLMKVVRIHDGRDYRKISME